MPVDYDDIMERGRRNADRYGRFLKDIRKNRKLPLEKLFSEASDAAFDEIDCTLCGRCCSGLGPRLKDRDAARMAAFEGVKPAQFIESRLRRDEDGDLVFAAMPCPFFGPDGLCIAYKERPDACRDYPHLDQNRQKSRIAGHIQNL